MNTLMGIGIFSWIAFFAWALSEIVVVIREIVLRRNINARESEKISKIFIRIAIYVSAILVFVLHSYEWSVGQPIANLGAILMLVGIAIRMWAVYTLGKSFTSHVSVYSEQTVVREGLYKTIRHPAYLGLLCTLTFWGIAFNSWLASCIVLCLMLPCVLYRIRVEERMLELNFGSAYREYCQQTWRLLPHIW